MSDDHEIAALVARAKAALAGERGPGLATEPIDPAKLARFEQAVAALRDADREVFLAQRKEGYTYAQIAARSGQSERKVRRRMARALYGIARHMDGKPVRRWPRWLFD